MASRRGLRRWLKAIVILLVLVGLPAAAFIGGLHVAVRGLLPQPVLRLAGDLPLSPRGDAQAQAQHWAAALRRGGYILHLRHAHRAKWDNVSIFDMRDLVLGLDARGSGHEAAVCLSAEGRAEAQLLGDIFALAAVPVGRVLASPTCRTLETAELAFGRVDAVEAALFHTTGQHPDQRADYARSLRHLLLTAEIPAGTNLLLSGHNFVLDSHRDRVIDRIEAQSLTVAETGFVILERVDGQIIARYSFDSLREFARAATRAPDPPAPQP